MRFKLTLNLEKNQSGIIPINYQYELSSWIYKVLNKGDAEFSNWLHTKGYLDKNKQFKLFTFSHLNIPERNIDNDRIKLLCNEIFLTVSFLPVESIETFIKGIFKNQEFYLGNKDIGCQFKVKSIEKEKDIDFSAKMKYRTISPLVIGETNANDGRLKYLKPDDNNYESIFINNLISKYISFNKADVNINDLTNISFRLLNSPKMKGIVIKSGTAAQTKVIGYVFDFELTAPTDLHKIGYFAGFGRSNSQGFGCVTVI